MSSNLYVLLEVGLINKNITSLSHGAFANVKMCFKIHLNDV